jgi:hypothetical protein
LAKPFTAQALLHQLSQIIATRARVEVSK